MSRAPRVWVIDDDSELRKLLEEYLSAQGFSVRALPDARDLERRLARERPDLLVLDVMLPGEDGLEVCRGLREARDDIPIIMLTARSDPIDRVVGMELGADDYVGKPFLPRELTARIHAVLRRRSPVPAGAPLANGDTLRIGECRVDFSTRMLWRGDRNVEISTGEFALLSAFARFPHHTLSRERLMELARGPGADAVERSMDVQISRLRKLIEPDPARPRYIQTVWGAGYVFVPDAGDPPR